MKTEFVEKKVILQAEKISEMYLSKDMPEEFKKEVIVVMKERLNEFVDEMIGNLN